MNEKQMQHGKHWAGQDLAGWVLTEKYDGARAYWDGRNLWTRGGIMVSVPASFAALPPTALDCELYAGQGNRAKAAVALVHGRITPDMTLVVFDAPDVAGDYETRMAAADAMVDGLAFAVTAKRTIATSTDHALRMMAEVVAAGGEGLMARQPDMQYNAGRTGEILKLKP